MEATARNNNKDASKNIIINHAETQTLNCHKIIKSFCHGGDFQGNYVRILMARGIVVFNEIKNHMCVHDSENISNEEIEFNCTNYDRPCGLMDVIFFTFHAKRGSIVDEEKNALKEDLNLVRLKWKVSILQLFFFLSCEFKLC